MSFLLRVEGVNQSSFIFDTQDLSTVRGAGLLLLDVAVKVEKVLDDLGCTADPIIKGASVGLFRVYTEEEAPDAGERVAEDVRAAVAAALEGWLPHATCVVDVDVDTNDDDGPAPRARLLTANRWRQMQAPSVVYPSLARLRQPEEACMIDKVRPAVHDIPSLGDKRLQSAATYQRRTYGRDQKHNFYEAEIQRVGAPSTERRDYTQDFDELCGNSKQWGNLSDKMAVIYLDGNKFSAFTTQHDRDADLRAFSEGLRCEQARILRALIEKKIDGNSDWENNKKIRLETLLWGGDEIIWVVPAWKGWDVLHFFCGSVPPTHIQPGSRVTMHLPIARVSFSATKRRPSAPSSI